MGVILVGLRYAHGRRHRLPTDVGAEVGLHHGRVTVAVEIEKTYVGMEDVWRCLSC